MYQYKFQDKLCAIYKRSKHLLRSIIQQTRSFLLMVFISIHHISNNIVAKAIADFFIIFHYRHK